MDACKTFPADNMNISDQPEQYLKIVFQNTTKLLLFCFLMHLVWLNQSDTKRCHIQYFPYRIFLGLALYFVCFECLHVLPLFNSSTLSQVISDSIVITSIVEFKVTENMNHPTSIESNNETDDFSYFSPTTRQLFHYLLVELSRYELTAPLKWCRQKVLEVYFIS